MRWKILAGATSGLLLALISGPIRAQLLDFSQWINPGPLAAPHQSLEGVKNCTKCHATAKGVPDSKCLDCHQEIAQLLAKKKGFHARQTKDCVACHGDHKGRAYDLNPLTRLRFNHDETGYPLTGKHAKVKCLDCHKDTRINVETKKRTARPTYLGTSADCVACHADIHKSLKAEFRDCDKCHTTANWKSLKERMGFSHNRETRYALTGAHVKVKCYACHKEKTWAPQPFESCETCHKDVHAGKYGANCTRCHNTASWKGASPTGQIKFDHDKTAFLLKGQHLNVSCVRCHGPVLGKMQNFQQCSGCHNNPHGNEFEVLWTRKKACKDCHIEDDWRILTFRHSADSRYVLADKHMAVPCMQCHEDRKYRWLTSSPDCDTCHMDPHKGKFKEACASCHSQKGFDELSFDHSKARFPLIGKHQGVKCQACHEGGKYWDFDTNCVGCHPDFHNKEIGNECRRCHSPAAYNLIEFDHSRESRFKLEGGHTKVPCLECHKDYKYRTGLKDCSSCHVDVHKGAFGTSCERCHTTQAFGLKTGFHDFGEFSLGGVHDRLDCLTCHGPKSPVRNSPAGCASCHKDPHMSSFGRGCAECHNQFAWLPSTFRHNQTGFQLSGAHRFVACEQCHVNRIYGGLPQECGFCHMNVFNPATPPQHVGAAPQCETCHFTFGWRPAR
ncbi:MAG: cytochrome c3 family protein [Pseudomonadota bacterium]